MREEVAARPPPAAFKYLLTATATTTIAFVAWLLLDLGAMFNPHLSNQWIYTGLLLPGAGFGLMAARATGRRAYFALGLLVTLIPLIAFVVLAIVTPEPPHHWRMD